MKKKLLGVLLSAVLVLGSINVTTFASESKPYGTDVRIDAVSEVAESVEEGTDEIATAKEHPSDEWAQEDENLEFSAAEISEKAVEEHSGEKDAQMSAENLNDDAEAEDFSGTEDLECDDSKLVIVEGELEGAYQFGDAPSERKIAAYSMRAGDDANVTEAEKYLYQEIMNRNATIDISKYNLSWDSASAIVTGLLNDYPELYLCE